MASPPKQVICVKWGANYGPQYVNVLYGMLRRNVTGEFALHCFTDAPAGIRAEVACHPLPELGCEIPPDIPGKWRKQALWARELPGGVTGTVLFLDLDTVLVGNIDDYFTFGSPDDVVTARNWAHPLQRRAQTSVFRFTVGQHAYQLDNLRADPAGIARKYKWEQCYVTAGVRGGVKFWPEQWTRHFRLHCLPPFPLRFWKTASLPAGAKIVTFPGGPNPPEVIHGVWHANDASRTPLAHIAHAWRTRRTRPGGFLKELKSYLCPVPWVAENWRE